MRFKRSLSIFLTVLFMLALVVGCAQTNDATQENQQASTETQQTGVVAIADKGYTYPEMLISVDELKELIENEEENVRILDVRSKPEYLLGHIPGAVSIWRPDYEAPEEQYGFGGMLCDKEQWEELMGKLGINNDTRVIIYDDNGVYDSARVWWALYGYGHENMQILDGGIDYWKKNGGETTSKIPEIEETTYTAKDFNMDIYATLDEVKEAVNSDEVVILDTRAKSEFTGDELKKGAFRKGRIPGAVWLEWKEYLNEDKTVKTAEELKSMFKEKGIEQDTPVITYCQSGVRSAGMWFTLRLIGYENVQNYDGSWIEWSYHEDLELETGE